MKSHVIISITLLVLSNTWLPASAQATFVKHTISASLGQPMDLFVADVNKDGLKDLITGGSTAGDVGWWEQSGNGLFVKHTVRTGFAGVRSVRGGDIDGDGDVDLIAASYTGNRIEWYENDGNQVYTARVLDASFMGAHTVQLTDLDQDGEMDILCAGWDNSAAMSEIAWWENLGNRQFIKHVVAANLDQSPFVDAADFDGDGDLDLTGSDEVTGEVFWWENNGNQLFTEHLIDGQFNLAHTVIARDLDKDGDPDILGAACTSGLLAWYENKGIQSFEKHSMPNLSGAIWLDGADFDLDGDLDMVATGMGASQLALFTNNGQQIFTQSMIQGALTSGFALQIADMDNDLDPDIVAIGYASNFLGWWENTTPHASVMKAPGWITPGLSQNEYLVVNMNKGNIILADGLDPQRGISNPKVCQAIALTGGLLYAAVGSEIIGFDPQSGVRVRSFRTDSQFIEGMTVGEGGVLFLSAPWDGKIIRLDPVNGNSMDLTAGLVYPRSIRYDKISGKILVLDGEETITLKAIDPASGEAADLKETSIAAGGDVEADPSGNIYISSPSQNSIFLLLGAGTGDIVECCTGKEAPWGMSFDTYRNELVVAMNTGDKLERIPASTAGIPSQTWQNGATFRAYPNPFRTSICLSFTSMPPGPSKITVLTPDGRVIMEKSIEANLAASFRSGLLLDLESCQVPPGLVLVRWTTIEGSWTLPLIRVK